MMRIFVSPRKAMYYSTFVKHEEVVISDAVRNINLY